MGNGKQTQGANSWRAETRAWIAAGVLFGAACGGSPIDRTGDGVQQATPGNQPAATPGSAPVAMPAAMSPAVPGAAAARDGALNPTQIAPEPMPVAMTPPGPVTPPPPAPASCSWRSATAGAGSDPISIATPFAAPDNQLTFTPPSIPCSIFDIADYGAVNDGVTVNTAAFAKTVAAATAAGGGVVFVPAGNWLTGPIQLASNLEFHVDAGATVLFTQNFDDYSGLVLTRWEGLDVMNWSPMIYARDATNLAITGTGTIDAQGSVWWPWKTTSPAEDDRIYQLALAGVPGPERISGTVGGLRPTFVECNSCTNLLIEGITAQNSAYWNLHPFYSSNVIIRDVHINSSADGTNGDGINPDSTTNMLIQNVQFETSDDCISIKSGLNEEGIRVGKPTQNLVIRNIHATRGHGGVSSGSEMSGGIHNLWVTESDLQGVERPIRIKTLPGRGGEMSNFFYDNLSVGWTRAAFEITTNYPSSTIVPNDPTLLPRLHDVSIRDITGTADAPLYNVEGLLAQPFEAIRLDNVTLNGTAGTCTNAVGAIQLRNSAIQGLAAGTDVLPCN